MRRSQDAEVSFTRSILLSSTISIWGRGGSQVVGDLLDQRMAVWQIDGIRLSVVMEHHEIQVLAMEQEEIQVLVMKSEEM